MDTYDILKALKGRKYGINARDIAAEKFGRGRINEKDLAKLKRKLAKLVKEGVLEVKKVKAYHRVQIRDGLFGGDTTAQHKELHYKIPGEES